MSKKFPGSLLRRGVPAVLTLLGSTGILMGANWIHQQQLAAQLQSTATQVNVGTEGLTRQSNIATTGIGNLSQPRNVETTNLASNGTTSTSPSSTYSNYTASNPNKASASSSSSQGKYPSSGSGPSHGTNPTTLSGDVGYTPVTGGTVQTITGPGSGQATLPSCVVQQYGPQPQTTLTTANLQIPSGGTFTLPAGTSRNTLLAIPLHQGVLWAVVPATAMTPQGGLGAAQNSTTLYYTPYPSHVTSHVDLTQGAVSLGVLPIKATVSDIPWTGWYNPSNAGVQGTSNSTSNTLSSSSGQLPASTHDTNSTTAATANNTASTATNSTSGTNPAGVPSTQSGNQSKGTTSGSIATSTSTQKTSRRPASTGSSSLPAGQAYLYLASLYATYNGAVITLAVNEPGQTQNIAWTYLWTEQNQVLKPLASLANGKGTYSWLAVGSRLVYWGQRSLIPPDDRYFKGKQFVLNVLTGKLTAIRLGTWTSQAQVYGDNLQFRVQDTTQWEQFTPASGLTAQ